MDSPDGELDVEALRSRAPGEDFSNPYKDIEISDLPSWWQKAIKEFEQHDLRPYRPPRFKDGVLKHEVVEELEEKHDIVITFLAFGSDYEDNWEVLLNEESIGEIGRHRAPEGYTVFETSSDSFAEFVESEI